ncbi:MAG: D,D-dipeptide ABC transporter permease, partial [Pseudomonadota bacterium]
MQQHQPAPPSPPAGTGEGWRAWLLTDTPTSRGHARAAALYQGWLKFRGNTLAMVGLIIMLALVLMAAFAP